MKLPKLTLRHAFSDASHQSFRIVWYGDSGSHEEANTSGDRRKYHDLKNMQFVKWRARRESNPRLSA